MDLQCIAHCTDEDYQLITIQGADDTLIHIKPSKTLRKQLLQQKKDKTITQQHERHSIQPHYATS